jgi:hypothetical protein
MANVSKNDQAVLRNLVKSGMVKPTLPRATDKAKSQAEAIASRQKELCK